MKKFDNMSYQVAILSRICEKAKSPIAENTGSSLSLRNSPQGAVKVPAAAQRSPIGRHLKANSARIGDLLAGRDFTNFATIKPRRRSLKVLETTRLGLVLALQASSRENT